MSRNESSRASWFPVHLLAVLLLMGCAAHIGCAAHKGDVEPVDASDGATPSRSTPMPGRAPELQVGIQHGSTKPRLLATIVYECDDGSVLVTQLDASSDGLWLFLPEQTLLLSRVPSASGVHYMAGAVSVWTKGSEATIDIDGSTRHGIENRRRSILQDARLRGVDFLATGNEPGWSLEIGAEFSVLSVDYGATVYTLRTRPPEVFPAARRTTYELATQGVRIRIVIEALEKCVDSMSGETFGSTVTVHVDERTLYGCGRPTVDPEPDVPRLVPGHIERH